MRTENKRCGFFSVETRWRRM